MNSALKDVAPYIRDKCRKFTKIRNFARDHDVEYNLELFSVVLLLANAKGSCIFLHKTRISRVARGLQTIHRALLSASVSS